MSSNKPGREHYDEMLDLFNGHSKPKPQSKQHAWHDGAPAGQHSGVSGNRTPSSYEYDPYDGSTVFSGKYNSKPGAQAHQGSYYYQGGYQGGSYAKSIYAGKVMCLTESGSPDGPYNVALSYKDWWNEVIKYYPERDGTVTIPIANCGFTYGAVKFNACVYTATDDYLRARWGRQLHSTDRDWLAEHPYATDDGIPQEYMGICIHAMMEPYGMGVSRIRVRRGSLAAGDSMAQLMSALGCNPFAMVDRQTTNAEAAAKLGMTEDEANKLWRFEFADAPLPGCTIIAEKGWQNGNGVQVGTTGGHARYLAPRAREGNWSISIQLAPVETIDYFSPIQLPEYVARRGEPTLMLAQVKQPDGKTPVAVMHKGVYYSPEEAASRAEAEAANAKVATESPTQPDLATVPASGPTISDPGEQSSFPEAVTDSLTTPVTQAVPVRSAAFDNIHETLPCVLCGTTVELKDCAHGTAICEDCYDQAWQGYKCPECNTSFRPGLTPWFIERDAKKGATIFECPRGRCAAQIEVLAENAKEYPELDVLADGCPDGTAEDFVEDIDEMFDEGGTFEEWFLGEEVDDPVDPWDQEHADDDGMLSVQHSRR